MKHYLMLKGFLKVGGCQLLFFNEAVIPAFRCNLHALRRGGFPLQSGSQSKEAFHGNNSNVCASFLQKTLFTKRPRKVICHY
jgi:hypothetical protein